MCTGRWRYFRVVLLVDVCLVLVDFWVGTVSCSLGFLGLAGCSSLVWVVQICGVISVLVGDEFVVLDLGCCGLLYLVVLIGWWFCLVDCAIVFRFVVGCLTAV